MVVEFGVWIGGRASADWWDCVEASRSRVQRAEGQRARLGVKALFVAGPGWRADVDDDDAERVGQEERKRRRLPVPAVRLGRLGSSVGRACYVSRGTVCWL